MAVLRGPEAAPHESKMNFIFVSHALSNLIFRLAQSERGTASSEVYLQDITL